MTRFRAGRAVRVPVERAVEHLLLAEPEHPAPAGWPGRIRAIRTDHYPFCWGCGLDVGGLGFDWTLTGQRLEARHVFPESLQGAPGIVHGGIVAALLDEACGQVARLATSPAVTSRLEIRYLAPVPVDQEPGSGPRSSSRVDAARSRRQRSRTTAGSCSPTRAPSAFRSGPSTSSPPRRAKHGEPTGFLLGGLDETQQCRRAARPDDLGSPARRKFSPRQGSKA